MHTPPAQAADAPAINALIHHLLPYCTIDPSGAGAEQFLETITPSAIIGYIEASNFDYLVGIVDERLVGIVAIRDDSHLYHLFVDESAQGKGYARQLWEHAKARAAARGNAGKFTVNSSVFALPIYAAFGFQAVTEKQEKHGLAYIGMELNLGMKI